MAVAKAATAALKERCERTVATLDQRAPEQMSLDEQRELASALQTLAAIYEQAGLDSTVERLLRRSIAVWEADRGRLDRNLLPPLAMLLRVIERAGRHTDADLIRARVAEVRAANHL